MITGKRRCRCYFPTYEYVIGDEVIKVEVKFGTAYCQYKRGDRVKIWYDENNPQYSYIDGYKEDTISVVGCLILGSIAVLCGLFVSFSVKMNGMTVCCYSEKDFIDYLNQYVCDEPSKLITTITGVYDKDKLPPKYTSLPYFNF